MSSQANPSLAAMPIYGQDHSTNPKDSHKLWALNPAQRVEAMWAGLLTRSQLNEWTRKRPDEVPSLGNEFAWIVMRTPEWDEEPAFREHLRENVVYLPEKREEADRVAA